MKINKEKLILALEAEMVRMQYQRDHKKAIEYLKNNSTDLTEKQLERYPITESAINDLSTLYYDYVIDSPFNETFNH